MILDVLDMAEQSALLRDMDTVLTFVEGISNGQADACRRVFAKTPWDAESMRKAIVETCHDIAQSDGHVTGLSFDPYFGEHAA